VMKLRRVLYGFKLKTFRIIIFFLLGISNLLIKVIKFKQLSSWLSNVSNEDNRLDEQTNAGNELTPRVKSRLKILSKTIESVSVRTPWRSMCFEQAITCSIILRWIRLDHTIFFGLKKDEEGQLKAHAWTKASDCYITGYHNMSEFKVIYSSAYRIK